MKMANTNETVHTNVKFKDRLFRIIFGAEENKKHLISLYNALNGTDYGEEEEVEITTLDDAIYIRMKNDISFIIASDLSLYEQQSTFNPNMPLRGFLYHGHLYEQYIKKTGQDIFGKILIKIPNPKYIVFYNGLDGKDDCIELKLSDAFMKPGSGKDFEWTATMLNINQGHNGELMGKCEPLKEYSDFIPAKQRAKCELVRIWRLPRGSNTPPLGRFNIDTLPLAAGSLTCICRALPRLHLLYRQKKMIFDKS